MCIYKLFHDKLQTSWYFTLNISAFISHRKDILPRNHIALFCLGKLTIILWLQLILTLESGFSRNWPRFVYFIWLYLFKSKTFLSPQHFPPGYWLFDETSCLSHRLSHMAVLSIYPTVSSWGRLGHSSRSCASWKLKVRSKVLIRWTLNIFDQKASSAGIIIHSAVPV